MTRMTAMCKVCGKTEGCGFVVTCSDCHDLGAQNKAMQKRLRELVPLLEDLQRRGEATGQEWAISIAKKGLALVKGDATSG